MRKRILALLFTAISLFSMPAFADEKTLIPVGKSIGVTLSTDGVMIVGVSEMQTPDGIVQSPAETAGIRPGDMIKEFNGAHISNVEELTKAVSASEGKNSEIVIRRNDKTIETLITPRLSSDDGSLKIGAWVKDAASGIGTMTYLNPSDNTFAALGHGICDVETGSIIAHDEGNILSSTIVSVEKGVRGTPGELKGVFSEDRCILGKVTKNTHCGIFGSVDSSKSITTSSTPLPIASREEIAPGPAHILTNVEGNIVEQFSVEIVRVLPQNTSASKDMIIKITDEKLISKTGGIVQGMSGSPVLQNGKLVGAVTHVFVNDPTRGYGIFIENMLAEAED